MLEDSLSRDLTPAAAATIAMLRKQAARISELPFDQHDAEYRRVQLSIEHAIVQNGFRVTDPDKADFIRQAMAGLRVLVGKLLIGQAAVH